MLPPSPAERYMLSSSPHQHADGSIRAIMGDVIVALLPAACCAVYFFGTQALALMGVCVATALLSEGLCRKWMGRPSSLTDGSAALTGLLLAFNLPPDLPLWMAGLGSFFAIVVAKQIFGGLGYNPFNPALAARAFLLISFTGPMTCWTKSTWIGYFDPEGVQALTSATPLGMIKAGGTVDWGHFAFVRDLFVGNVNGCLGEVSALALLVGAAYLLWRKVITWHIPASFIAAVALFAAFRGCGAPPLVHVLTGGVILGAFFMATDYVTSPITPLGKLVFGAGCGLFTMLIRTADPANGGYPEGVSFSILVMNAFTPLINRWTRPRTFGRTKPRRA